MKTLITFMTVLFFTVSAYAQNTYTLKATIKDAKTKQALKGATIKVQNTNLITLSDEDGGSL